MDIVPATNNGQLSGNAVANATLRDVAAREKSDFQANSPAAVAKVEKPDVQLTEGERSAQFERAAQRFFKDVFAVRDNTFSIFKDGNGQYITRITNLRDGSVTYIPEPEVLRYMESMGITRESLLKVEA